MLKMTVQHPRKSQRQANQRRSQDEHDTAHGRSAALGFMPLYFGFDFLPSLFLYQPGDIGFSKCRCKQKRQHKCAKQLYCHGLFPAFLCCIQSATISRSSMWCFSCPMI